MIESVFQNTRAIQITRYAHLLRWTSHKYYKWLQTQQQTQILQKRGKHKHLVKISKCPQSALSTSNELPTNLTSPVSLGSRRWAILNLHKFYHLHELTPMCRSIQTNTYGHVHIHFDANFAFRDVSRIPRLLLATWNIVPAHIADCDILPGDCDILPVFTCIIHVNTV